MANLSIVLDGLALHTEPNGPYLAADDGQGIDWGSQAVADALLNGQYRPEEYDQAAAEQGLRREVVIPMRIRSTDADTARTQEQALIQRVSGATIYTPKQLTVTPKGSTHTSTFTVYGGAWQSNYTQTQSNTNTITGTLTLICYWPVLGATQSLGSSGSPLLTNTATPANVTLSPSPVGDVPGDVTLFVNNRGVITQTVQLMTITATGGSWKASYNGTATSQPYTTSLTAGNVQTAIQGIVGSADVTVTGANGGPYTITFINSLAYNTIPLIADASLLTGGAHTEVITQIGTTPTPIRSIIAAGVSNNTTWVGTASQSTWTLDSEGLRSSGQVANANGLLAGQNTVYPVAHFTAPTLPADRRFRVYLAAGQDLNDGAIQFRLRVVSGSVQATGEWRAIPDEFQGTTIPYPVQLVDMGAWTFPVGDVGQLGPQGTIIYVEAMQTAAYNNGDTVAFSSALFAPEDSMLTVETEHTGLALNLTATPTRVESDSAYDSGGNPVGMATTGTHIRTMGGRYLIVASQGFTDTLDPSIPWAGVAVDVWATYTPRFISLA